MQPRGTLSAHPNPAAAPRRSDVASTTLSWTFTDTAVVEVRVGSPDGPCLTRALAAGSAQTGDWVTDGLTFYLQDVSEEAPGTAAHTLAMVTVSVVQQRPDARPALSLGEAHRRIGELERDVAELEKSLRRAEHVRREASIGLKAFAAQAATIVHQQRRDRAWRLMLQLRKAHALLVRQRSPLAFLKWLPRLRHETTDELAAYERGYPVVADYVPSAIHEPFDLTPETVSSGVVPGSCARGKYDVVMLPVFEFDFRRQRPQQIATEFARAGHRVFWISPSRRPFGAGPHDFEVVQLRENLWEVHLEPARPDIYTEVLGPQTTSALVASLAGLYKEWAIVESTVVVQLPFWTAVASGLRDRLGARLVFDCMDDWESMPGISEFNRTEERALVAEADLVVLTARRLHDKYAARARKAALVPNAVEYDFFSAPVGTAPELDGLPRPLVGYVGAIAAWFDYALMREVIAARPQYSFVFIGALGLEQHVIGEEIARFRGLPNVRLLGHKNYDELPAYVSGFDVCTIPFVIDEVTRSTDPVKIYEYFSLGRPVVATPMPELADRSDLLYIGATPDEFARQLDAAVAENGELGPRRRAFAAANTWSHRVEAIDEAVTNIHPLVSILIVTHNSLEFVDCCLDSVLRNTSYPNFEVIIADNASSDETPSALLRWADRDRRIRVQCLPRNLGFAGANNAVARQARGAYLVLLNIDTVVTPGWVGRLMRPHREDPSIGQVVPVTNWAGNEAKVDVTYTNLDEMERFALRRARDFMGEELELTVAPLFCTFIPMDVWQAVGELDDGFEIGMFEDDDYSLRVRRSGRRVVTAEDCFVHHFGRGSFAKLPADEYRLVFERNLRHFEQKWGVIWAPHRNRPGTSGEHRVFEVARFMAAAQPGTR